MRGSWLRKEGKLTFSGCLKIDPTICGVGNKVNCRAGWVGETHDSFAPEQLGPEVRSCLDPKPFASATRRQPDRGHGVGGLAGPKRGRNASSAPRRWGSAASAEPRALPGRGRGRAGAALRAPRCTRRRRRGAQRGLLRPPATGVPRRHARPSPAQEPVCGRGGALARPLRPAGGGARGRGRGASSRLHALPSFFGGAPCSRRHGDPELPPGPPTVPPPPAACWGPTSAPHVVLTDRETDFNADLNINHAVPKNLAFLPLTS